MKTKKTLSHEELDKFLSWFATIEEVSLGTRRDFFAHLLEVRHFDEKAKRFVNETLKKIEKNSETRAKELEKQIQLLGNIQFLQQKAETSLAHKIANSVCEWMEAKAQRVKSIFRAKEKSKAKKEEFAEETENQLLVDRLKASLN